MKVKRKPSRFFYFIPILSFLLAVVIFTLGIFTHIDINNAIKVQCPGSYTINFPTEGRYIILYNFNSQNNSLDYVISKSPIDLESIKYTIYNKEENTSVETTSCLGNYSYTFKGSSSISLVSFKIDSAGTYQFNTTTNSSSNSITLLICKTSTTLFILCTLAFVLLIIISIISFIIIFIKRRTLSPTDY